MTDSLKAKYWAELAQLRQEMADLQTPAPRSEQQARGAEQASAGVEQDPPMPAPPALSDVEGVAATSRNPLLDVGEGVTPSTNSRPVLLGWGTTQSQRSEVMPDLGQPNPYAGELVSVEQVADLVHSYGQYDVADRLRLFVNNVLLKSALNWDDTHGRTRPDTARGSWD